jgi:ATP-dependent helicase YprA (DUF1998 family)
LQTTPSQAFGQVEEALAQYLETQYRIAHPAVFAERGEMLRQRGTIAQAPFIEATPNFAQASKLADLERRHPEIAPPGISELMQHGVPVDRYPLYTHQEQALLDAFSERPNLLVATGTGSGKTETFLLPILSDILREARTWEAPSDKARRGEYDAQRDVWMHSRRHERRPAAVRAIVLYPMNALVNDQLTRLRRILAMQDSPDWQRDNLNNNVIHFGMYTGITRLAGSAKEERRRKRFKEYMEGLEEDWTKLPQRLRDTGGWPRPDSPEMLCRWDMQAAPPDILVTNYSMLEYMLVRPIEDPIFEATREWLQNTADARLTLVVDEAHTYTGATGTEVSHLIRRLKERIGVHEGSDKFRAIATSASIPNVPGADDHLRAFTSDLFGEPADRFSLIRLAKREPSGVERQPEEQTLHSFAAFQGAFDLRNPRPAIEKLAEDLDLGPVDVADDPQVSLHRLLHDNPDVEWVRERTARNATPLDELSEELWAGLGIPEERATAGVLTAGSFARATAYADTPPLLSMRVHAFFRGIPGLWACMDPDCPEVGEADQDRPVGKLYSEPRPWCDCGARVLELFSCRHCGLLFLGGVPDTARESLWPWSDDLSGEPQSIKDFRIFGAERPDAHAEMIHRSTRTTLPVTYEDRFARPAYEVVPAEQDGTIVSPFPKQCPRCQRYRQFDTPERDGREVVENLRTKGPQSFATVVGNSFRNQPRSSNQEPNFGRKALLFSDARVEAAKLAADLRFNHASDLIRQLLYRALNSCAECGGSGEVEEMTPYKIGQPQQTIKQPCQECNGTGMTPDLEPLNFLELRRRVIQLQLDRGIDPTPEGSEDAGSGGFFTRLEEGDNSCYEAAEKHFNIALRREIAEDRFSLEPLGLANWRVNLPEDTGVLEPLTEPETKLFIQSVTRLLATENVILPPEPFKPWEWDFDLLERYQRKVLLWANRTTERVVPYNLSPYRKLGRYAIAVSNALVRDGRLADATSAARWLKQLRKELINALIGFRVLQAAGRKIDGQVPWGIRLDSFSLHPLDGEVSRCRSCAYVMSEALLGVCVRCGQDCERVRADDIRNYYRLAAIHALPNSPFDDPHPLRSGEHTAQVDTNEARDEERWFQDLFHDDQNPLDHRMDVLSVTTTMEMGIDIGSLLFVGLRNVPPTVANYQQRSGRAGRRGSSIATVFTFAQNRSHDQYYFDSPPEIVSDPPRVPALYLDNEVIARRHVRSLVLQDFFMKRNQRAGTALFETWGTVAEFGTRQTAKDMRTYLATNRAPLLARCERIVSSRLFSHLGGWIDAIPREVQKIVDARPPDENLFEVLIRSTLLPSYAFPVDVVRLSLADGGWGSGEGSYSGAMQRDLKIAVAEYAPGAEIIRQSGGVTYKYKSVGVYDPFATEPDYSPTGILVECEHCRSVTLLGSADELPDQCAECGSFYVEHRPYLRPQGFTVDSALPSGGREVYKADGRERSGYAAPARLLVGEISFNEGQSRGPFADNLYTKVRMGDLVTTNSGPSREWAGYLICPECGRSINPEDTGKHKYPADVPPHYRNRGPRAGDECPNQIDFTNQVLLGHTFASEIILLGADLPHSLDAPFTVREPAGRAVWYSFGTLVENAAARVLQIDPDELKTGVRPVLRAPGRLHGEVFLYDDVPGGAGYARAIDENLEGILERALELGRRCPNPDCAGACYRCLMGYRNQALHPLLDRELGTSVLEYLLNGAMPSLSRARIDACGEALTEYARAEWKVLPATDTGQVYFPRVLENRSTRERVGLWVIHPLAARPSKQERQRIHAQHGIRCAVHTAFDLERRPFWVLNHLLDS